MKKHTSHNKLIKDFHEANELPFSVCRNLLKEYHWDFRRFTDEELDAILTIFATYLVDVADYYIEDKFLKGEHFYTFVVTTLAPEEQQSSMKSRLKHLFRSNNIVFYLCKGYDSTTYNFIRMSPDRRTSHLHRYEIKSFIAEVMELVRYNFFCLNNLKYECEFAGYLWENNNVFIDIVDSDGNKYKGIMTVDDVYEFRNNTKYYIDRISNDIIHCFQETYDYIAWASH